MTDLYKTLGVKRTAAPKDIHKAYRKKAKSAHPDSGGSVEAFNTLVLAYSVLSLAVCIAPPLPVASLAVSTALASVPLAPAPR